MAFAGAEQIDATLLTEPSEMDLIRMLAAYPQEIVMAAEKYDPSRINRFVIDLASAFHRFYGSCRIQGADPVSYTHLDVYKRQGPWWWRW